MNIYESKIKFIKGKNLYLRPVLKCDFPEMLIWMNDEDVLVFLSMYFVTTEKMEMDWIERKSIANNEVVMAIVLHNGTLIGTIGLHQINWKDRTATSGCYIGHKESRGNKYGTEAKMLLLRYAFYDLNLRKINTHVFSSNTRSLSFQKSCGGKIEGVMEKQVYKKGEYVDQVFFGTFKNDFDNVWEKKKDMIV